VSPRSKTQKVNDWNTLTSSEKSALRNTLTGLQVNDWNTLTSSEKAAFLSTPGWRNRISREAGAQMRAEQKQKDDEDRNRFPFKFMAVVALLAIATSIWKPTPETSAPIEPTAALAQTPKPAVLVAGAEDELWTYLNDNFEGTDWFLWVDSANYYVDGPVRVIDLNLNGFISTDREAAKSIAQTACIAIYTFWIDQERNGKRAFEVLFVGDGSGNVYRREDYAAGERCSGD
jgi:hypothetical protein